VSFVVITAEGNRHPAGRVRGVGANCSLNNQEKSLGHADDANWTYSGHLRSAITRSRQLTVTSWFSCCKPPSTDLTRAPREARRSDPAHSAPLPPR